VFSPVLRDPPPLGFNNDSVGEDEVRSVGTKTLVLDH
jgi:hypothetical protein